MDVHLFVPCFVELYLPEVAVAAVRVLRRAGCRVHVPAGSTCCGQPALSAGHRREAAGVARSFRRAFAGAERVVVPSGSCAAMISRSHRELLGEGGPPVFEFSQFLVDELGVVDLGARCRLRAGYHDGCHSLRELGVSRQPRALLGAVEGLELVEVPDADRCCGFGGAFSFQFDEVSVRMADAKLAGAARGSVEALVSTEPSCLLSLSCRQARAGGALRFLHVAQVLAGDLPE